MKGVSRASVCVCETWLCASSTQSWFCLLILTNVLGCREIEITVFH